MIFSRTHKKKKKEPLTFRRLLLLLPVLDRRRLQESIKNLPCPRTLCGRTVPATLNSLSYGTLDDLSRLPKDAVEAIVAIARLLLDVSRSELMEEEAVRVVGFIRFVREEIRRIDRLFSRLSVQPTPEEAEAGIASLAFGTFGILDWYARRMGIQNQNDVRSLPWVRIYKCMEMDTLTSRYERRLNKVYSERQKRKSKTLKTR